MSRHELVIRPRPPRTVPETASPSAGWHDEVIDFIHAATAAGQTVTVSASTTMLTPAEVASLMGISRATVSRRIAAGALKSVQVGAHHRIPYLEFRRFWLQEMGDLAEFVADDIWEELTSAS